MTKQSSQSKANILIDTLKTLDEPVRYGDLIELTEDRIDWGANPAAAFHYLLSRPEAAGIHTVRKGLYTYEGSDKTTQQVPEKNTVKSTDEMPQEGELTNSVHRAQLIANVLKHYGTLSWSELREKAGDRINWGSNPTSMMNGIMKKDPNIQRVGKGYFKYVAQEESVPAKPEVPVQTKTQPPVQTTTQHQREQENEKLLTDFRNVAPLYMKQNNKELKRPFKIGEKVTVRVSKIESYGAFVNVMDDTDDQRDGFNGLIHLSTIRKDKYLMFRDLPDYFTVGDVIEAKVNSVRADGKVGFDTFDTKFPVKYDSQDDAVTSEYTQPTNPIMAEKLAPVAHKIVAVQKPAAATQVTVPVTNGAATMVQQDDVTEQQFKEIETYLNPIVGMVTPDAKQAYKGMIRKLGLFKFSRLMAKAEEDFEKVDPSLQFARMMEDKAGEYL